MYRILLFFILMVLITPGCKKFLDEKPYEKQETIENLEDLQKLLNNEPALNQKNPKAAEISADDYYLTDVGWKGLNDFDKRIYTWDKHNLFPEDPNNDWSNTYAVVKTANIVLYHMDKVSRTPGDEDEWRNIKGQALFLRGYAFLQAASIWTVAYDDATAHTTLGIPLRLDPDDNIPTTRSTLKQTYDQIIGDLKAAADLLPLLPRGIVYPSKAAAYAVLARTYLSMGKYTDMGAYADQCLKIKATLKDFNAIQEHPITGYPFAPIYSNEEEIIMAGVMATTQALNPAIARIDSGLYALYNENDLRKKLFFRNSGNNTFCFRGSYTGSWTLFTGLATDEVYLMRAEYYARSGKVSDALNDLNILLQKRFVKGTFVPPFVNSQKALVMLILTERRKELIMRGLRWIDVKRLNKENAGIVLKRVVEERIYTLTPNSPGYAMPIPEDVIRLTGIKQNPI